MLPGAEPKRPFQDSQRMLRVGPRQRPRHVDERAHLHIDHQQHPFLEHNLRSVTANTREDGCSILELTVSVPLQYDGPAFPLAQTNDALQMLKHDRIVGAAVLRVC